MQSSSEHPQGTTPASQTYLGEKERGGSAQVFDSLGLKVLLAQHRGLRVGWVPNKDSKHKDFVQAAKQNYK